MQETIRGVVVALILLAVGAFSALALAEDASASPLAQPGAAPIHVSASETVSRSHVYDYRPDFARRPPAEVAFNGYDAATNSAEPVEDLGRVRRVPSGSEVRGVAPRGAIGFAPGEGVSALTPNRSQHGTRHLTDAGVLPPWRGSSSPQIIRDALSPVLERPRAAFDHVLGGTRVRGFLGDVNGQQVADFVYKEGPYQGQLASSVIPTTNQLAKWGVP